jgi:hypothetical protein
LDTASSIAPVRANGKEFWVMREQQQTSLQGTAHLLPPFDNYLLDYKDRSSVLKPAHTKRVNAGGGMPKQTIVLNGRLSESWRREMMDGKMIVTQELFRRLNGDERTVVENAVRRYGDYSSVLVEIRSRSAVLD